jgi:hypothetical protein
MSGIIADNSGRHTGLVKAASAGGVWNLIETLTSDGSDADLSFTSGIDSTYDEYVFKCINIHAETGSTTLGFQVNASGESGYNETMTTTDFRAYHGEADDGAGVSYKTDMDQAQGTAFQAIMEEIGNSNDDSCSGTLHLFAPSDTTFVKHFFSRFNATYTTDTFVAGYINTTAAIDDIQFKMSSGEIQGGSISLYGIT